MSSEQHFSRFTWNNVALNLAGLHFAALDADGNNAPGDRLAYASFNIAKNEPILRVKVY